MAHIKIVHPINKNYIKTRLMYNHHYLVDIHFPDEFVYKKAVECGFDKEMWEKRNSGCKVIIENGHTCFRCSAALKENEYGECRECITKRQKEYKSKHDIIDEQ
mgnify:CR=1 FL=1